MAHRYHQGLLNHLYGVKYIVSEYRKTNCNSPTSKTIHKYIGKCNYNAPLHFAQLRSKMQLPDME